MQMAVRTPLVTSQSLACRLGDGCEVRLKLETLQPSGAFKLRGASNAILGLSPEEGARGIVTCSTGNHGRAVAFVAKRRDYPCTVFLSKQVPANKVAAIRALGVRLEVVGDSYFEAEQLARARARERGQTYVHPFDDLRIIAGQGTVGLELLEDWPQIETVVLPVSGGGLLAGVGLALKSLNPAIRVVGVSMARGAALAQSLKAGRPVHVEELPTLADCLEGNIGPDNRYTLQMARELADEIVLLTEAEIAAGMRHLFLEEKLVAEGAAAVAVGALLAGKIAGPGRKVALLVTGNNVDMATFSDVVGGKHVPYE